MRPHYNALSQVPYLIFRNLRLYGSETVRAASSQNETGPALPTLPRSIELFPAKLGTDIQFSDFMVDVGRVRLNVPRPGKKCHESCSETDLGALCQAG